MRMSDLAVSSAPSCTLVFLSEIVALMSLITKRDSGIY